MKFVIILLLVGIVTVSCLPKRGGGGRGGGAKKPCKANGGIESCICTDESTCESNDDCKANCGKRSDNPIVSCTCANGESWTPKKRGGGRRGGRGGGRGKRVPCKANEGIESCICTDGSTCDSKDDCKANCGKRSDSPIVSCTCGDGESWTPRKGGRHGNKGKPCGSWRNTESCTCNGVTYEGREEKKSCDKDEIEYCTCDDGSTWEPEEEDAEED